MDMRLVAVLALALLCLPRERSFLAPAGHLVGPHVKAPAAVKVQVQPSAGQSEAPATRLGLLGLSALALLAASRGRGKTLSRVIMQVRKPTRWAKPAAKGMKPMIHRKETRDVFKDGFEGWVKHKDKNLAFMEKVVRQQLHGRVQFQFAAQHFVDAMPLTASMVSNKRNMGVFMEHDYDDMFYVRKYLEPAKFKKLSLANWEMPENATRVVTMRELVDAGVQYGHKSNQWNPAMLRYLYADNDGTHIFDLVQTAANLNRACYYLMEAAAKGATFLMVGTKEQAREIVAQYSIESGVHYCDLRYVGGVISNFAVVRKAINLMLSLREEKKQNAWSTLDEFQQFLNDCKLNRLTKKYHGIETMTSYPDICIFVDEVKERGPINEMTRIGIPTIGMVDSNNNPKSVDIPIPSNTSSSRSIDLIIRKLSEAIKKGKTLYDAQSPGDREEPPKEWDPWILSRDRMRFMRRRSKRQGWMKGMYGSYENWKKCHPFGAMPTVAPFHDFKWNDMVDRNHR